MRAVVLLAATASVVALTLGASPASAAGPGVGDVSDAMVYGPSAPVGAVLAPLISEDDESTTIAAPFAINFFGTKYDGLCITTNGTISPVLTPTSSCSNEYDYNVENLALQSQAPVIAALALDLDPSEQLWVPGVSVATFGVVGGVATITTTAPHPFLVGDTFSSWFAPDDPSFDSEQDAVVVDVPTPTSFTFATGLADEATRPITGATVSVGDYDDTLNDSDADGLADDGFGAVKQVYEGTTVIGGKAAVVITWYRVPTNDTHNSPLLSNTLQVVLIQEPTANGVAAGFDFTIQLNIGTATDNDDGYSSLDPTDSCEGDAAGIAECRWGMGWANYDPVNDTADSFELFAASPINQLVDSGGSTALVNNRLNSTVLGRYTWGMVGGVTAGFAPPSMDGTDSGTLAPLAVDPALAATGTDSLRLGALGIGLAAAGIAFVIIVRRRGVTELQLRG